MTVPQPSITEDFNATATAFLDRRYADALPASLLLTKFSLLMNHKAGDEKRQLVETLFGSALQLLRHAADPEASDFKNLDSGDFAYPTKIAEDAGKVVARLADPQILGLLPYSAADDLADAGLALLKKAENPVINDIAHTYGSEMMLKYRDTLVSLAAMSLEYADVFKASRDKVTDVTTSQPVSPSKPLTLKKPSESA